MQNKQARFQVVETRFGYAGKDTRDGTIWTQTYKRLGDAINRAAKLQEAHGKQRYC